MERTKMLDKKNEFSLPARFGLGLVVAVATFVLLSIDWLWHDLKVETRIIVSAVVGLLAGILGGKIKDWITFVFWRS